MFKLEGERKGGPAGPYDTANGLPGSLIST